MKHFCLKNTAQIQAENEKKDLASGEQACWPDLLGLWRRLTKEFRLAFLAALGIGFLVHLFVFSNLLINHDGVVCLMSKNSNLTSGRWALSFFPPLADCMKRQWSSPYSPFSQSLGLPG